MFKSSGPLTDMKLIPASLATAFANRVFPQPKIVYSKASDFFVVRIQIVNKYLYLPGGPQRRTPAGVFSPSISNAAECFTGPYRK
jgi:hypothetical protein